MRTKKWSEVTRRAPVPEEPRKAAEAEMQAEIREYNLAETLGINHPAVSKLE